jgi:hypothetical protein
LASPVDFAFTEPPTGLLIRTAIRRTDAAQLDALDRRLATR